MAAVDHAPEPGPFAGSENTLNKDIMIVANSLAEINTWGGSLLQCWLQPMEERLQRSSASTEKRTDSHFHGKQMPLLRQGASSHGEQIRQVSANTKSIDS